MTLTATIKLNPTREQFLALSETLEISNKACNWISEQAFNNKTFGQFSLHKLVYYKTKERSGLSAQMVVRCIAKVTDSYKIDRKVQRKFKKYSAQPFDMRIFRFMKDDHISIWTIKGRQKIPFQCGKPQHKVLENQHGEVDLIFKKGIFYIAFAYNVDESKPIESQDVLGIDLGVVNIAVASNGKIYSGKEIDENRRKASHRRRNLQRKGTASAKRKLKKLSGKQSNFQKNTNHCISKAIVADAKRLSYAIALENLKGIRKGIKANRRGRAQLHNWAFYQLKQFILYKAKLVGIPVLFVDPKNTSRECPVCHHVSKSNRLTQSEFLCKSCGFSQLADYVASLNIRDRAAVNQPMVSTAFGG